MLPYYNNNENSSGFNPNAVQQSTTIPNAQTQQIFQHLKEVKLVMKKNWQIFPVDSRGIDFLGFVFYHRHIRLRKRIKRRMMRKVMRAHRNGKDKQEIHDIIASWWGWLKYTNSINLVKTIEKSLGYEIKFNRHADRIA